MKSLKTMTGDALEQIIDYKVVDQNGEHVGSLHSLWSDPTTGAVEFLGVKTGWLFGHNHVVPADKADLDEANGVVRLPYEEAFIKDAPSISADSEISESEEENIYRYYSSAAGGTAAANTTGTLSGGAFGDGGGFTEPDTTLTAARTEPVDYAASNVSSSYADASLPDEQTSTAGALSPADATDAGAGSARWRKISRAGEPVGDALGYPTDGSTVTEASNADPITGEPRAHPVGTGLGAASVGAAGATIGAIGGPVGSAIGGVAGAIGGGLAGKGVAEAVNPTAEDTYWQDNYRSAPYYEEGQEYSEYAPAYRLGYEGYSRFGASGRDYSEIEPDLEREYIQGRGTSSLGWEKAKAATRDAWERLKAKASEATK